MKAKKYSLPTLVKIVFLVFAVIIIGLIGVYFHIEKKSLQQEAEENLVSIARLKIDQIVAWRKDRLQEGAEILTRPRLVDHLIEWLTGGRQNEIHNVLIPELEVFRRQHKIENILLVSADGTIRFNLNGPLEDPEQLALELTTAFRDRMPILTELHTDKAYPEPHISTVTPLFFDKEQTRPAGAVIMVSDPSQFLYPLVQSWPVKSDSAETLLVRGDGDDVLFLNSIRHQSDTALKLRIPLSQSDLPAAMAIRGERGVAIGNDYRGVEVVSVLLPVPESPWFMVAKVDAEEIFAPWRSRALLIIGLLACLLAMLGAFAMFARQYEQKRQYLTLYQTEAELRAITERHSVTLKSIGDAVIVTNTQGHVELLNSVAEELTGWRDEEARGRSSEEVFHIINEHTRALVESPVAKVVRSGMVVGLANHTLLVDRTGGERPIADSGAPIRNAEGEITGVVLAFRDQSEERAYQSKILESESFYRQTLESIPGMVFTTRPDGFCDYQSQQWVEYTGVPMDQHLGNGWNRLLHPDDQSRALSAWHKAVEENAPYELEYRIRRHDGVYEWFRVIGRKIHDKEGRIIRWFGTVLNIEALKQAEHALVRLNETLEQQVSERTQLAEARTKQLQALSVELIETEERERQRIAHLLHDDLQQLLAAARFQLQAISGGSSTEPVLASVTQILEESIAKSRRLAHELSPPVLHRGSLYSALQWLAGQMREQFGIEVLLEADSSIHIENGPAKVLIFRAVQELLFNTIKHAGVNEARVALSCGASCLTVTVSDRGKGFDKANDAILAGTGFGLLSIRERSRRMGGDLEVESLPGAGSRISLTLPISAASKEGMQSLKEQPLFINPVACSGSEQLRVLFVDDHKVMRQGLIRLISGQPNIHILGEAADGREAVQIAFQLKPDVIVMDISMPEMDGIEATRRIKAELPDVRIIGLSMFEDEQAGRDILDSGAETFVAKTASSAELLKAIYGSKQTSCD
ncbi:MAG: hypothetical protein VR64_15240 [Desulfatitalea sp. BRH_c12]|nr:MAG: hypothetical protein VR64_15240 [Desulfatitalea sp. BRH_c12]